MNAQRTVYQQGITLVEVMIVIAILGVIGTISKYGLDSMNKVMAQERTISNQIEAQNTLDLVVNEIQNAEQIVNVSPGINELVIAKYLVDRKNYDVATSTSVFDPDRLVQITYRYDPNEGGQIERTVRSAGLVREQSFYLTGKINLGTDPVFEGFPVGAITPAGVKVTFHVNQGLKQLSPLTFQAMVGIRSWKDF